MLRGVVDLVFGGGVLPFFPFYLGTLGALVFGGVRAGLAAFALGFVAALLSFGSWADIQATLSRREPALRAGLYWVAGLATVGFVHAIELARTRAARLADEARRTAHEAERWRALLDTIFESAPLGIGVCDRALRMLRCNPALAAMAGRPVDTLADGAITDLIPDLDPALRGVFERVVRTGQAVAGLEVETASASTPDGARHFRASVYPVRAHGVPVFAVAAVLEEITERRRSEEDARRTAALLHAISENTPDLMCVKDRDGRLLFANATMLGVLGKPATEVIGRTERELLARREEAAAILESDRRVLSSGSVDVVEERLTGTGGERIYLSTKAPLRHRDGTVSGLVAVLTDITQRTRAERALREADRRKDEFLAMLAHELRNPLAPIRNAVSVLREAENDVAAGRRARDIIDRQVDHLSRLIDDLLDISRITRGMITLRRAPVLLSEVVDGAVETVGPIVNQRRQVLTVLLADEAIRVEGDRARLVQVLGNLLNNAAKFTPPGGHVTVTTRRTGSDAVIAVHDTGIGIPAEARDRIFELFSQEDVSLARSQGGLGIGLTLVRALVEMHGGRVEVESEGRGRGTEFRVVLPALPAALELRVRDHRAPVEAATSSRRRVLIVEDNVDAAETYRMLLESQGHEVRTVYDGLDALGAFDTFRPDVAFLDLGLPGLDGFELARRLRMQPGGEVCLLIAVSGYASEEDRALATQAGFDQHLTKPVDIRTVLGAACGDPRAPHAVERARRLS